VAERVDDGVVAGRGFGEQDRNHGHEWRDWLTVDGAAYSDESNDGVRRPGADERADDQCGDLEQTRGEALV